MWGSQCFPVSSDGSSSADPPTAQTAACQWAVKDNTVLWSSLLAFQSWFKCHCSKGLCSQTPLVGLRSNPEPPYCPCVLRPLYAFFPARRKPKRRFIQKLALTFPSHYGHTHSQTAQTHQAKGHHKNPNSFRLFCKCLSMSHHSALTEYLSHTFSHRSFLLSSPLWPELSPGTSVMISKGEFQPFLRSRGKRFGVCFHMPTC